MSQNKASMNYFVKVYKNKQNLYRQTLKNKKKKVQVKSFF